MEPVYIPRLLDEKDRILFFHLYELVAFVMGFGLGIAFSVPVLGILLGLFAFGLCRWLKRKGYLETIVNTLYWYIPSSAMSVLRFKLEGTPPSALRIMTG